MKGVHRCMTGTNLAEATEAKCNRGAMSHFLADNQSLQTQVNHNGSVLLLLAPPLDASVSESLLDTTSTSFFVVLADLAGSCLLAAVWGAFSCNMRMAA